MLKLKLMIWVITEKDAVIPVTVGEDGAITKGGNPVEIYMVTFDANGGSSGPFPIEVVSDETITLPEEPVKESYVFAGWFDYANRHCQSGEAVYR
jgi:hypothetical protein